MKTLFSSKALALVLFLITSSSLKLFAQDFEKFFVVNMKDGSEQCFLLKDRVEVGFQKNYMVFKTKEYPQEILVKIDDCVNWSFASRDPLGMEQPEENRCVISWTGNLLTVKTGETEKLTNIQLYNLNGAKTNAEARIDGNICQFETSALPSGFYLLSINGTTFKLKK